MRLNYFTLLYILCFLCPSITLADLEKKFYGTWMLSTKDSDAAEKVFKGKLRKHHKLSSKKKLDSGASSRPEETMKSYWDIVREGQNRRAAKNLKRLGSAYPLVTFREIKIKKPDNENFLFEFEYDGAITRKIKPSLTGKEYSAKGDELVKNVFGHTLSYFQGAALLLETDTADGSQVNEKISLLDNNLIYQVTIDSPILVSRVGLSRVYKKK